MGLFDIIGPVMIGPSSSHTAGAARLGRLVRRLAGQEIKEAVLHLHGSFAATYRGHGTDKALIAGLLDLPPWDERLRGSFALAEKAGLSYRFVPTDLGEEAHPTPSGLRSSARTAPATRSPARRSAAGRWRSARSIPCRCGLPVSGRSSSAATTTTPASSRQSRGYYMRPGSTSATCRLTAAGRPIWPRCTSKSIRSRRRGWRNRLKPSPAFRTR